MSRFCSTSCAVIITLLFASTSSYAADTTETFDIGATDFEFYLGFDGIGLGEYEKSISAEGVAGYGLVENLSAYLAISGAGNEYFSNGEWGLAIGFFGTPLDSEHVDIDLFLEAGISQDDFSLIPALELNFDLDNDQSSWGLYFVVSEVLSGREKTSKTTQTEDDDSSTEYEFAPMTELTAGTYWTVGEGHQLLLEYDMGFAHNPSEDERDIEIGAVALGYNVVLNDAIEMINQVTFDIPQEDEEFSIGISMGIIVTLPTGQEEDMPEQASL